MPVARCTIAYRKSRRLREFDSCIGETFTDALLAPAACMAVKIEPRVHSHNQYILVTPSADTVAPVPCAPVKADYEYNTFFHVVSPMRERNVSSSAHIPRPRNAFIIFRSEYLTSLKGASPLSSPQKSVPQSTMSCLAADVWRGLGAEERRPYFLMAEQEKMAHVLKYPGYRYVPIPRSVDKSRKPKAARRRRSASSNPALLAAVAEIVQPVAESLELFPVFPDDIEVKSTIARSPIRPASYDRMPGQFGFSTEFLPPTLVEPLIFASPQPSRPSSSSADVPILADTVLTFSARSLSPTFSSPPVTLPSDPWMYTPLELPRAGCSFSKMSACVHPACGSRPPSPAVPSQAVASEWDSWLYGHPELNADEPLQFDAPDTDLGFFHSWNFNQLDAAEISTSITPYPAI
ncbi:hypothetical protein C8R45DRAFT_1217145 [Mycena sanguinolenta]|nr:hypothetical protein C8R45DRAFT_1217145 [Mycena sanguinolenta]